VIEAVEALDLGPLYGDCRDERWVRALHEAGVMVVRLLFTYAAKRFARGIERRLVEDLACAVP
jgi:hypothetical protein